jgi:hypothetical protein
MLNRVSANSTPAVARRPQAELRHATAIRCGRGAPLSGVTNRLTFATESDGDPFVVAETSLFLGASIPSVTSWS